MAQTGRAAAGAAEALTGIDIAARPASIAKQEILVRIGRILPPSGTRSHKRSEKMLPQILEEDSALKCQCRSRAAILMALSIAVRSFLRTPRTDCWVPI